MQLAAAIAAHRHQRQIGREAAGVANPGGPQRDVDQPRPVAHQVLDGLVGHEPILQ